jgi:hypothetical protein
MSTTDSGEDDLDPADAAPDSVRVLKLWFPPKYPDSSSSESIDSFDKSSSQARSGFGVIEDEDTSDTSDVCCCCCCCFCCCCCCCCGCCCVMTVTGLRMLVLLLLVESGETGVLSEARGAFR